MARSLTAILVSLCLISLGITVSSIMYSWSHVRLPGMVTDHVQGQEDEDDGGILALPKRLLRPLVHLCHSDLEGESIANVLIAGIDGSLVKGRHFKTARTDSIHLLRVYSQGKHAALLSVPRDLRVELGNGGGWDKINAAYVYGGQDKLKETLSTLFSYEGQPMQIDRYLILNLQAFIHVVDAFGGIDLNVEKKMKYKDSWGGLDIDLKPGLQHLDGRQAMGYVRFRHDRMGDLGRIVRQQNFGREFIKQTSGIMDRFKLKGIYEDLVEKGDIQTDLGFCDLLYIKDMFQGKDLDNRLIPVSLPVVDAMYGRISFLEANQKSVREISEKMFRQPKDIAFLTSEPVKLVNACPYESRGNFIKSLLRVNGVRLSGTARQERGRPDTTTVRGSVSPALKMSLDSFFGGKVRYEPAVVKPGAPIPPPAPDLSEDNEEGGTKLDPAAELVLGSDACRGL